LYETVKTFFSQIIVSIQELGSTSELLSINLVEIL